MDLYSHYFTCEHVPADYTQKCINNNIVDYKTCIDFHKLTESNLYSQKIKERFALMETMKPLIKNCIENNISETSCFYSKDKKNEYNFPLGFSHEFNYMWKKILNENKK